MLATKTAPYPAIRGMRRDHTHPTLLDAADPSARSGEPASRAPRDGDTRPWPASVWFEPPWGH